MSKPKKERATRADAAPTPEALRDLLDEAVAHLKEKDKEKAQACVDAVLAADPEHLDAHIVAAHLLPFGDDKALETPILP